MTSHCANAPYHLWTGPREITNKSGTLVVRGDQFVFLFMSNERLMEEITKEELRRCKKVKKIGQLLPEEIP